MVMVLGLQLMIIFVLIYQLSVLFFTKCQKIMKSAHAHSFPERCF